MLYGTYPKWWQLICILLHDVGYIGMDYYKNKSIVGHAELGAKIAKFLFGQKGFDLVAGHTRSTAEKFGISLSELEPPDDFSWVIVPRWFLIFITWVDPSKIPSLTWQRLVEMNWCSNGMYNRGSSFDMYLAYIEKHKI